MKIHILPSTAGRNDVQYLTTFVVDDRLAIDAGALGFWVDLDGQAAIDHVFLTHSHADHVCSLPMFVSNVFERRPAPVVAHGHPDVLAALGSDMFNGRIWPDFLRMQFRGAPLLAVEECREGETYRAGHLTLTPVGVTHPVPTFGYVIDDGTTAVVTSTDSTVTNRLWEVASTVPHLKAVFIGVPYPDEELELAERAGHLTPGQLPGEVAKMPPGISVIAVHLKPTHYAQVAGQVAALGLPNVSIGVAGRDYIF